MIPRHTLAAILALTGAPALAAPLSIVADTPLTAALVEAVAGPDHEVTALLPEAADPHHAALRPSQARALAGADLVVANGAGLTPWLDRATAALGDGRYVEIAAIDGVSVQIGDGTDPHLWLDPANGAAALAGLAAALGALDPDAAEGFAARADAAAAEVAGAAAQARDRIAGAGDDAALIAVHDAWGHAREALALGVVAAVQDGEGDAPGAAGLSALRELIANGGTHCLIAAPGEEAEEARRLSATLDLPVVTAPIMGEAGLTGTERYLSVFHGLADAVESCARG
ncbi:zinc ABC transporter substrate-binding protein [Palleronia sediminis]|uniref:Zinc ABC transporter substrate-binding protein n=1 Tax=Palleronia sediminis TaxID=2547833 RepID=A0A4R6AKJ6_9RHOB|nr:metal ABC transporter substrate-binding protein [Palleronia sediminis]TDL83724.1 zinc ABC transporter substrate-binding protein [Palleronia sediminis]